MQGKCEGVREQLSAWLDDELSKESRAAVAAHLAVCAGCRRELAQLAALEAAWGTLEVEAPAHLTEKVLARLSKGRRPWWQDLALAASLVLGIILGGALARDFYPLQPENGGSAEIMALEAFQDFPQGSLGAILVSYQGEEGNGT